MNDGRSSPTTAQKAGTPMDLLANSNLIEAASWRLAATLVRRHPDLNLMKMHPGGGQYDVLCIYSDEALLAAPGIPVASTRISLNRVGRIHVESRADGRPVSIEPVAWSDFLTNPMEVVERVEHEAGLPQPEIAPLSRPAATYIAIAGLAGLGAFAEGFQIEAGFIDASNGSGPAEWWPEMESLAPDLTRPRLHETHEHKQDLLRQPGYRFWKIQRGSFEVILESSTATMFDPAFNEIDTEDEPEEELEILRSDYFADLAEGLLPGSPSDVPSEADRSMQLIAQNWPDAADPRRHEHRHHPFEFEHVTRLVENALTFGHR
jgi:hypothetical protein